MSARLLLVITALAASMYATETFAGCYCTCVDGQLRPACSNSYDIPPICPTTTCARSTTSSLGAPPLAGSRSSCRDQRVCDAFQRCEWKTVCRGDDNNKK
jgi:hypothetical protein